MSAGRFVGRVGGLAVALGIGVAAYSTTAVASADTGAPDSGRSVRDSSASAARHAAPRSTAKVSAVRNNSHPRSTLAAAVATIAGGSEATAVAPAAAIRRAAAAVANAAAADPVAEPDAPEPDAPASVAPQPVSDPEIVNDESEAPVEVADSAEVDGVVTAVAYASADSSAGTGGLPAPESPLSWALLAAARRHSLESSQLTGGSVTVTPTVIWGDTMGPDPAKGVLVATPVPGVLVAKVNATSAKDLPLAYVGVGKPSAGGKIGGGPLLPLANFYGTNGGFSYIPNAATLTTPGAGEQFRVMALELSKFDQRIEKLLGAAGKLLVPQVLAVIHRIPIVGTLLSPLIGGATIAKFDVTPYDLAAGRPTAFTYKMPSFDGTLISVNYFPATNVSLGQAEEAPTILAASGLACAANTDPLTRYGQLFPSNQFGSLTPGIAPLRNDAFRSLLLGGPVYNGGGGYNVVTWDPRGEFASGGQLNIDNPMLEGRDVSSIISWLTSSTNPESGQVQTDQAGDPLIGMTGGSYGGGIQLTTVDPRIDAITPQIGWNSLISSLYPGGAFKTGWATILAAALAFTGARVNPAVYAGILQGDILGKLTPSSEAVLASVGPTTLLTKEGAATMLFQGIHDTLFPLSESVANGQTIQTSPANPPLKLFWFCGGHGDCDLPVKPAEQDAQGVIQNLQWLDTYVAGSQAAPADRIPTFQWYDQNGLYFNSDYLPWDPNFNDLPTYNVPTSDGGFLPLWPAGGGSGPYPRKDLPFSIVNAGKAWNAVNVDVAPPAGNQVVGAPTVSFTYKGRGTGHTVYAQLVDNESGLVLSNIVTPIQVELDGKVHTVSIPMEDIVYTAGDKASLTLQITSSSINYANAWSYGWVNISNVNLALPQHATVVPPPWTP